MCERLEGLSGLGSAVCYQPLSVLARDGEFFDVPIPRPVAVFQEIAYYWNYLVNQGILGMTECSASQGNQILGITECSASQGNQGIGITGCSASQRKYEILRIMRCCHWIFPLLKRSKKVLNIAISKEKLGILQIIIFPLPGKGISWNYIMFLFLRTWEHNSNNSPRSSAAFMLLQGVTSRP